MTIEENIPLAPLTTFKIGGAARFFSRVRSIDELREAFTVAAEKHIRALVLGGGSNVLLPDEGFDGLVVKIELAGLALDESGGAPLVVAAAGEEWDALVRYAIDKKLWGLENLSGIPGTVGGAVAGNIGAYGQALSQTLAWVETLDTGSGQVQKFSNEACAFGYRDSFFKHGERYVIMRAAFSLSRSAKPELSYRDVAARFTDSSTDLQAIREAVLAIRAGKFPDLSQEGTAGSFFKNPIVPQSEADRLRRAWPELPVFAMPEAAGVKVPLAWFLDKTLGLKGYRVGGARLFEKQPLVIAAEKNCSAEDVKTLAREVERQMREKIGITIEREVKII